MATYLDGVISNVVGEPDRPTNLPTHTEPQKTSAVVRLLVSLFGWGLLSAALLQRIAAAVIENFEAGGATPPQSLSKIAEIGVSGHSSNNCRRDLIRYLWNYFLWKYPIPISIRVVFRFSQGTKFQATHC